MQSIACLGPIAAHAARPMLYGVTAASSPSRLDQGRAVAE